jgi:hypothetical protein
MRFEIMLSAGFGLLLVGVLTLPIHMLPQTTQASGRTLVGVLMLVFGGALIGRAMLA